MDWRSGRDDSSCAQAPAGLPQKIAQLVHTFGCPRRQARVSLTINITYNSIRVSAADLQLGENPSANLTVAFWCDSAQHKTTKIAVTMTIRYWRTGLRISYVNRLASALSPSPDSPAVAPARTMQPSFTTAVQLLTGRRLAASAVCSTAR